MTKTVRRQRDANTLSANRLKNQAQLYSMPLAYEVLHWKGTAKEVRGLARISRTFTHGKADPRGTWLEPACGTGRYLRAAATLKCAQRCLGVDLSDELMAFGRESTDAKHKTRVRLLKGDMTRLEAVIRPNSVDFAFNLINTIRHVRSDAAMLKHLKGVRQCLRSGGVYVVGLSLSWYGVESPTEDVWQGSLRGLHVLQTVQYLPASGGKTSRQRMEKVLSHLQLTQGRKKNVQTWDVDDRYELLSYNLQEWLTVIDRSGFHLIATVDEQGNRIPPAEPGYTIFVLGSNPA